MTREYFITEVYNQMEKSACARAVLESLPDWFGNQASLEEYVEGVCGLPFWAALDGEGKCLGFFSVRIHYGHTGDIYVCGVRPECHRMGVGRALYGKAEQFFLEKGCKYAMVETLSEKADYEPYEKTRLFYESVGFEPLITLTEMWDENNPCLIMVKQLALQSLAAGMNRYFPDISERCVSMAADTSRRTQIAETNPDISTNIRRADKQDIPRIAEIIIFGKRVAYRSIFQDDYVSFNEMQVVPLYEAYKNDPDALAGMYLYDDGIVKGVINSCRNDEKTIEITDFYVEPFFVGQGIGTLLIKHTIRQASLKGIQKIILWVIKDNVKARKFYEANGFVDSGETRMIEGTMKTDCRYEYEENAFR